MVSPRTALNKHSKKIRRKANVVGTGVGEKWAGNIPTAKEAVIVFVREKLPASKLAAADLVPDSLDGVPTDVIAVGDLRAQAWKSKIRPIRPGFSCGHSRVTAGTIGGFFEDRDGQLVLLSNNHVIANENQSRRGDHIYQPGVFDGGKAPPSSNSQIFRKAQKDK